MGAIRWVCLSDLHLGALNSVLTEVAADGTAIEPSTPSPVLTALCECLRMVGDPADPPDLVILGDLFELALGPTEHAGVTFAHLVRGLRPGTTGAAVSPLIRFVPGNHDHHLWNRARGEWYLDQIEQLPQDEELPPESHITALLPARQRLPVRDRLIELLAVRADPAMKVSVEQSYPNIGMASESGERVVVGSHGHFIEPLYRAMSALAEVFATANTGAPTMQQLEAENGAWIDFFWSSMGDSGAVSGVTRGLYESLQSEATMEAELDAIGRAISRRSGSHFRHHIEGLFAEHALGAVMKKSFRRERHVPEVLSANAKTGLSDFLSGPLARQLSEEVGSPREVTFLFGHTHKPFLSVSEVAALPEVSVVNTGGWVVDTPAPEPNKGAAVVLVDDQLNVAVLRCYTQGSLPSGNIRIEAPVGQESNPLVDSLRSRIDPTRDPWAALAESAAATEAERRAQLDARLQRQATELDSEEARP
jgi:hypothetical protein